MRIVVKSLLSSLPYMRNVLTVGGLILLIYAITGVNFFKGTFYSCVPNEDIGLTESFIEQYVITKQDCLDNDGEWVNSK